MCKNKRYIIITLMIFCIYFFTSCSKEKHYVENVNDYVKLIWYQLGAEQKDSAIVMEKINEYTKEKIGVTIEIRYEGWNEYSKRMQVISSTKEYYDMAFTSSWSNDYILNAKNGNFLDVTDLLEVHGKSMFEGIDQKFFEGLKVGGRIYGVPHEKELGNMPMWVFTKEYVDKYNIPYEEIHSLEQLEPWLKIIKDNEPDVVPLYLNKEYTVPNYMDKVQEMVGIEYGDDTLTVKNFYETEKTIEQFNIMRKYYMAGYINEDAAITVDDNNVKRFVTKGDGQPFADKIWSKNLSYDVVVSPIMDVWVTNASARGGITAISKNSKHPEEAMKFLNLLYTDEYLRNLLNYGIEGVHYSKVELSKEEYELVKEKPYIYKNKIKLTNYKNYSVPYWVQGSLYNTYVFESEPLDKWSQFQEFNKNSQVSDCFGFDFDSENVKEELSKFGSIMDEFGAALHTGSVDPNVYLSKLNERLYKAGIDKVILEMQRQVDIWKEGKIVVE